MCKIFTLRNSTMYIQHLKQPFYMHSISKKKQWCSTVGHVHITKRQPYMCMLHNAKTDK